MTTPKFFTAWQVFTTGITRLVKAADLDPDTEIWRGADGSYAAGDISDIYDADPETDLDHYTYEGTAAEYK